MGPSATRNVFVWLHGTHEHFTSKMAMKVARLECKDATCDVQSHRDQNAKELDYTIG